MEASRADKMPGSDPDNDKSGGITIKSAESRLVIERGRIAKVLSKTGEGAAGA